jgi:hypothetical protein
MAKKETYKKGRKQPVRLSFVYPDNMMSWKLRC